MNVQFAFPRSDAYLIESDTSSIWSEDGSALGERRLYVMTNKVATSSAMETSINDGVLETIVDSHRKYLTVEKHWASAMTGSTSLRDSSSSTDVEALWSETAPVPPTAVLSACFSLMPLQNAVVTSRPQDDSSTQTRYSLIYPFCCTPLFGSRKHHAGLMRDGLSWESFLTVLHSVCFNDAEHATDSGSSRFALSAYMSRSQGELGQRGANNTSAWPEALLWKLLNSLVSCLAVYHSAGLHFNGELTAHDVVCFCATAALVLSVEDTLTSFKADPKSAWSDKEKQVLIKTVSASIALPQAFVVSETPAACAFFVVTRLPCPVTTAAAASSHPVNADGPGEAHLCQQRDLASVGHIMQSVMTASQAMQQSVSPELAFLVAKLTACAAVSDDPATAHLSAIGLCQLQALRLRSGAWLSKMEAEEYSARLKWTQLRGAPVAESDLATREANLEQREKLLKEREEKLNVLMELYELTATQLDSLPEGRGAAFRALRQKLESLSGAPRSPADNTSYTADTSAALDVSPVNYATPRERSVLVLEESLFTKEADQETSGRVFTDPGKVDMVPLFREYASRSQPGHLGATLSPGGRRRSSLVYESEATLSSPSAAADAPRGTSASQAFARHALLATRGGVVEEEEESDSGTGYSGIEESSAAVAAAAALHTPPRQRLSPAKVAYSAGASASVTSTSNPRTGVPQAGAADTHTPARPSIPSLGKGDLSSQSKYTSIYMGPAGPSATGHHATSTPLSSASRHLHFDAPGAQRRKNTPQATPPPPTSTSSRAASAPASEQRPSSRRGSHSSTGGRRSPRAKTDEGWIQHQYNTLEELRRSFSVHSNSAPRPSQLLREDASTTTTPKLRVANDSRHGAASPSLVAGVHGGAPFRLPGTAMAAPPSPVRPVHHIDISPVHTPTPRTTPWHTPVSSASRPAASQSQYRPSTAPSSTATMAGTSTSRLGRGAGQPTASAAPSVQLNTPGGTRSQLLGSAKRPAADGTMDLLQRLRATL